MKNDILPPPQPEQTSSPSDEAPSEPPVTASQPDIQPTPPPEVPAKRASRKKLWISLAVALSILLLAAASVVGWYVMALRPIAPGDSSLTRVRIEEGSSPVQIGELLEEKGVIRSSLAFDVYTRLTGVRTQLQYGVYRISPSESTAEVVDHLTSGKVDTFRVTFLPGATLKDTTDTDREDKVDVETVLRRAGYSQESIDEALVKDYAKDDRYKALFAGKPASAGLEGYIYGETYEFNSGATAEEVIQRTLDELDSQVQKHNLAAAFKKQGLTLYQGLTLASIIQREVSSSDPSAPSNDQRQVAQVFYLRLHKGMPLGSDVTAYYGADKIGARRSVAVDTPYNTRIHTGLPPGPIAAPSLGALEAAAHPAKGDYLYFLSGDDDVTYFARTNDEHERNITAHCHVKCSIP